MNVVHLIGLLLGGVLKSQEMIKNAKVRNVADQASGIKGAFFDSQDRYRALPADYLQADQNISGLAILHQGKMKFTGSPQQCCEIYAADDLEAAYLKAVQTDRAVSSAT